MLLIGVAVVIGACAEPPPVQVSAPEATAREATPPEPAAAPAAFPVLQCDERYSIRRDPQGRVVSCYLTAPLTVGNIPCAAGGIAEVTAEGKLVKCRLAGELKVGTLTCTNDVEFFPSGKIKVCTFAERGVVLEGVKCGSSARLYESGKLENCSTAEAITFRGHEISEDISVSLSEDGTLRSIGYREARPYKFKSYTCMDTHFHPNGSVSMCETAEKLKIKGEETPLNVYLCFDEKGNPAGPEVGLQCVDWSKLADQ